MHVILVLMDKENKIINLLDKAGVLNNSAGSLEEMVQVHKRTPTAWCNSLKCLALNPEYAAQGVKRSVNVWVINCPYCGHALKWKMK